MNQPCCFETPKRSYNVYSMNQPCCFVTFLLAATAVFAGPVEEARASFERGQFTIGDKILSEWMRDNPDDERIREGFHLLEIEGLLASRRWPTRIEEWAVEPNVRGELSLYYGAIVKRKLGEIDEAIADFLTLIESEKLVEPSRVQLVETYLAANRFPDAKKAITEITATNPDADILAYLRGLEVRFWLRKADPKRALAMFDGIASGDFGNEDLFHAGLAALHADDETRLVWFRKELEARKLESRLGELAFEEGMLLADRSDSAAFEKLATFLRDYPDHSRSADAEIALAEKHLNQVPPQPQAARDRQASAQRRALTLKQSERLDYSSIWTELIGADLPAVVEKAARFLPRWPRSERRPEVLMMLGRAHFEQGHYPKAIEQFEQLSALQGDSELIEIALFFAAKAASLTLTFENHEKALTMWETVAERGGQLASNARHEQGLLKLGQNKLDDALAMFEKILSGEHETSDELQIATLCDSGHTLFLKALATDGDETLFMSAIESFQKAEAHPAATKAWKYQAKVRRGKCLEALDKTDDALALYFSIVRDSKASELNLTATTPIAQFDWLYRAGFSAIEILEQQENWKGAVLLAELLAETGGPRAIEASERANQLRLKEFVWEGDE